MVTPKIFPFWKVRVIVTTAFDPSGSSGELHRGIDLANYQDVIKNPPLYSMINGVVYDKFYSDSFGNTIILKADNGMGFLYAHMMNESPLSIGNRVTPETIVGYVGTTGISTGIHLHLEMQDLTNHDWVYKAPASYYTNPATFMGINNSVDGTIYYYEGGTPVPPPLPPVSIPRNKKFPWAVIRR